MKPMVINDAGQIPAAVQAGADKVVETAKRKGASIDEVVICSMIESVNATMAAGGTVEGCISMFLAVYRELMARAFLSSQARAN